MDEHAVERELADARKPGSLQKRLRFPLAVPRAVKGLVKTVLELENDWQVRHFLHEQKTEVADAFSGLSDKQLRKVIKTLVPTIADTVEAAWHTTLLHRPYQAGQYRKPFRCPTSPTDMDRVRGHWLVALAMAHGDIDRDIRWLAAWTTRTGQYYHQEDTGWLLAGALDAGGPDGEAVFDILKETASGEHAVGRMGGHVCRALMSCGRADAWEYNEKLLLAAQRQEGLRQHILEAVDESHPTAFRRMLRLILDENLARFSSVVRAFDTWFGFMWDGASGMKVNEVVEQVLTLFDDASARDAALAGDDPERAYLALWTTAFTDVQTSMEPGLRLLGHASAEMRFVATHFLCQTTWSDAIRPLLDRLDDEDLRVAARALMWYRADMREYVDAQRMFETLARLMERIPKRSVKLDPIVWPWWSIKIEKTDVAEAMGTNTKELAGSPMLPYIRYMEPHARQRFLRELAGVPQRWSGQKHTPKKLAEGPVYETVIDLLGDTSPDVREAAFLALQATPVRDAEIDRHVALLSRKAGDLRNRCLERLALLDDGRRGAAVQRLLDDRDAMRQKAGQELLGDEEVPERTETTENALGLVDPADLRTWDAPRALGTDRETAAANRCLAELAELVLEHGDVEVDTHTGDGVLLLIDAAWQFPRPRAAARAPELERELPIVDVWKGWIENRPAALRDPDGMELARAWAQRDDDAGWRDGPVAKVASSGRYSAGKFVLQHLLEWCVYWTASPEHFDFLIDGLESALAALKAGDFREMRKDRSHLANLVTKADAWERRVGTCTGWLARVRDLRAVRPDDFTGEHARRVYGLLRWFWLESHGEDALAVTLDEFLLANEAGLFGEAGGAELQDLLVGRYRRDERYGMLAEVTRARPPASLTGHPDLMDAIEACRRRIVEVECRRGDRTTPASIPSLQLRTSGGLEAVSRAMEALGSTKFARSGAWWNAELSRKDTLSHILIRSAPRDDDTPEAFGAWAEAAKIKPQRLVELATYAPQWVNHVNHHLGWPGLEDAVWWLHAHTKDDRWQLRDITEAWAGQVSERTPLTAGDLTEGAVDVAWFHEARETLGDERWEKLFKAAKYASSSGGHKRAQLFAEAMTGAKTADDLLAIIDEKRHQDSVRALGLVPLAEGDARRDDLLARYHRLQEFRRESRKFGSQRQQSEGRAVTIAMENLARTAGFKDPLRLTWAMEMESIRDLAEGPVVVERDEVTVSLEVDAEGRPAMTVTKKGKKLRGIPAKLKKDEELVELKARVKELKRQASRTKGALEESMIRGDVFEGHELMELMGHPVLAPSLARLVFIGEDIAGYPVEGGRALRDQAGKLEPVRRDEELRIVHPQELLERGDWHLWQRDCFQAERVQPFKQLFRELYPLTDTERGDRLKTRRYAGHQVNPRQALALLGGRGWVSQPEEGVTKTYHAEGLTARLDFDEPFYTPADIEGLTLEDVVFTAKGGHELLDLATIPPVLFSETMRDLDLVVSVAHQGGVDPEASASTVEARAALVRETCRMLSLDNVEVKSNNAIIEGKHAKYSLHLGSAIARLHGGATLVIVAVHSQHRGRLFLPFADDDPRTAEVLSKLLLLSRDHEIKDPSILNQLP